MLKAAVISFFSYSILQWANRFHPLVAALDQSIFSTSYEKFTGILSPFDQILLLIQATFLISFCIVVTKFLYRRNLALPLPTLIATACHLGEIVLVFMKERKQATDLSAIRLVFSQVSLLLLGFSVLVSMGLSAQRIGQDSRQIIKKDM